MYNLCKLDIYVQILFVWSMWIQLLDWYRNNMVVCWNCLIACDRSMLSGLLTRVFTIFSVVFLVSELLRNLDFLRVFNAYPFNWSSIFYIKFTNGVFGKLECCKQVISTIKDPLQKRFLLQFLVICFQYVLVLVWVFNVSNGGV